jgi:hypothetical protein
MRAALVSATSLAALLAFEVGLDVAIDARPAHASAFTAGTALDFGNMIYVLVSTTATALETVTNGVTGKNTITLPGVSNGYFSGAGSVVTVSGSGATAAVAYTFAPLMSGGFGNTFTISSGANAVTVSELGVGVAPFQSTTVGGFGAVRIGTTATVAAITVSNIGDGDLAPGGSTLSMAQLRGSIGAPSGSVFTGSGGTFSLNDQFYSGSGTATTSAAYTYQYAPTAHTTSDSATVVANFADGSTSGTNAAQTATLTLAGSGVGPEFQSKVGSTTYSNTTAIGNTTIAAGTISTGAYKTGTTTSLQVTLANISTDAGSASLTDLTLENFTLSGASASDFSVVGFTTNTVLAEAQSVVVTLDFSGPTVGNYTADLNFTTDEGAALGGAGAVFSYTLSAKIPEPATLVTFGMGLAGLGWVRRRRARRALAGRLQA